jgi:hypothetical protein
MLRMLTNAANENTGFVACGGERDSAMDRGSLSYLLRNKRVVKTGDRLTARWSPPDEIANLV